YLNRSAVPPPRGPRWSRTGVVGILSNPKYVGCVVFGRNTRRLGQPPRRVVEKDWIVTAGAHRAIVDPQIFAKAQTRLGNFPVRLSNEAILDELRKLLALHGRLTGGLIDSSGLF